VCHYAPALTGARIFLQTDEFATSLGVAVVSLALMTLIAPLSFALDRFVLSRLDLGHLRLFLLIILLMSLARIAAVVLARSKRWTPQPMFTLLMTAHCGVLGVALVATGLEEFMDAL
jgi:Na+-translocating ferredoxin:NAD+ oxidoreductase RnfA subunit